MQEEDVVCAKYEMPCNNYEIKDPRLSLCREREKGAVRCELARCAIVLCACACVCVLRFGVKRKKMCFLCRCAQQDVSTPFLYMLDLLNVAQQWTLLAPGSLSPYQHITGRRAAAVHFVMVETTL